VGLKEYKSKRRFEHTPEPDSGASGEKDQLVFVVHKHAARHLHYDLRLELDGVLKSWAVPKGPSMNPSDKKLAMMVEDHPFDYKDFEGVIPEGNYGAGSVIIWDNGIYYHPDAKGKKENERLLRDGLEKGNMKFILEGQKLGGQFALVKTRRNERSWLLLKKKDRFATEEDVLRENRSVVSKKTLEELFSGGEEEFGRKKADQIRLRETMEKIDLKDAPEAQMPHRVKPMLATPAKKPFDDPEWIFEVKWDGYRATGEIQDGEVALYSRNLISLKRKFPPIADELKRFGFAALLDGEIVIVDEQGHPDFQMLQNYTKTGEGYLLYYVYDLLHFDGRDLSNLPLIRRKEILKSILPLSPRIKFSDHVTGEGLLFFDEVKKKGLEGIIAKHSRSVYVPGIRSRQWLKVKTQLTQDAVIGGFTEPKGGRKYFGSLVLGVFEGDELVYIGHSGGGFDSKSMKEIRETMDPLISTDCPFRVKPKTNTPAVWLEPKLVCEVALSEWTGEGLMRHPVFLRMREDKDAHEVVREEPG
jgi:bifunctional non-homologous end joining protein LigD